MNMKLLFKRNVTNGISREYYEKGKEYDVDGDIANILIENDYAEEVKEVKEEPKQEPQEKEEPKATKKK